jgi:excisionase family DNA binding protein
MQEEQSVDLLTVQETAALLKVAPITVRRLIEDGRLPAVRIGKSVRIEKADVQQLLRPVHAAPPRSRRSRERGHPLTLDDPSFQLIGMARSGGPSDVAERTDEYLAEAYTAQRSPSTTISLSMAIRW